MYTEYHDLPSPKDGSRKDCWLSISEFGLGVVAYHYTTPGGSYVIEHEYTGVKYESTSLWK